MRLRAALALALFLLPLAVPPASAACAVPEDGRSVEVLDGHHLLLLQTGPTLKPELTVELWKETNGASGLQTWTHRCADGSTTPADALVTRASTTRALGL